MHQEIRQPHGRMNAAMKSSTTQGQWNEILKVVSKFDYANKHV